MRTSANILDLIVPLNSLASVTQKGVPIVLRILRLKIYVIYIFFVARRTFRVCPICGHQNGIHCNTCEKILVRVRYDPPPPDSTPSIPPMVPNTLHSLPSKEEVVFFSIRHHFSFFSLLQRIPVESPRNSSSNASFSSSPSLCGWSRGFGKRRSFYELLLL